MENCNFCEKSFNHKISLKAHMIKAHQILEKEDSEDETIPETSKDQDDSNFKKCECDICENISVILNSHVTQDHDASSNAPSGCEACNSLTKACQEMSKIHLKKSSRKTGLKTDIALIPSVYMEQVQVRGYDAHKDVSRQRHTPLGILYPQSSCTKSRI